MNGAHWLVALCLTMVAFDADALYKCVQVDGAVEFQQMP